MSRVLVAGLGAEHRGDDAAGLLAVRALRELGARGIDILEAPGDALALVAAMPDHDEVVLVDAVAAAGAPGRVVELEPAATRSRRGASTHGFGVHEALAMAAVLGACPTVRVLGITGNRFAIGTQPSAAVVRAARAVAMGIKERYACA